MPAIRPGRGAKSTLADYRKIRERVSNKKVLRILRFDDLVKNLKMRFPVPVVISGTAGLVEEAGLAPVAVAPEFQRQGIGSALINAGIRSLEQKKAPLSWCWDIPNTIPALLLPRR